MTQLPLLSIEQSLELYKNMHAKDPAFGMDIFSDDFKYEDILILENNGKGKAGPYTRCGFYILILSLKGESIRYINQYEYRTEANSLQLLVPGVIHSFEDITDDQHSYIILFKKDYFGEDMQSLLDFHRMHLNPVNILGCGYERFKYMFEQIDYEYKNKQDGYKEIAKSMITQLLYMLKRDKLASMKYRTKNRAEQIMDQYKELIEEHYQNKKTVAEYADILEITAKHLSETVKELTGRPALFYIHIRILKEIQYLLVYTKLSVKQIANLLNFENPSDLGRFFKKFEGQSPSKYRLENIKSIS